MEFTAR